MPPTSASAPVEAPRVDVVFGAGAVFIILAVIAITVILGIVVVTAVAHRGG